MSRRAKKLALEALLGSLAPLVLVGIVLQRSAQRRTVRFGGRVVSRLRPFGDRLLQERNDWRREITFSEVLDWVLQLSPGDKR